MSVILEEDGRIGLTNTTKHCLLHTVHVLLPQQGLHTVLPRSGSHKIDNFCNQLSEVISAGAAGGKGKRKSTQMMIPEDPLVNTLEVNQFYEGALSVNDFSLLIEKRLVQESNGDFDVDALHRVCWNVYHLEKRSDISFPRWFSDECMYRLWLIFNTVLEPKPDTMMPTRSVNEILKRLVELCGYTWNPNYEYTEKEFLDYPQYLEAITRYFDRFGLDTSLTCEVIQDMRDEIVDGVIKKGYLTKKGHKRRNWKKRWFILQRTIMRYFESREKLILKGQLVLNGNTDVKSMPDKGKRMYCFEVTCGKTGVPFEICSDDQRSKHDWMLAIKKAIALAKVLEGSATQDDFTESLAGFYLLKYGTPQPKLIRQDSTIRGMKFQATMARQRKRLSGKKQSVAAGPMLGEIPEDSRSRGSSLDDQDEYVDVRVGGDISSDDSSGEDDDGYLHMNPAPTGRTHGYQNVVQSLPSNLTGLMGLENLEELGSGGNKVEIRKKSPSMPTKVRRGFTLETDGFKLKEEPDEEETREEEEEKGEGGKGDESDSDESYDDVEIVPVRYTDKTLMDSEDLPEGYVHLLKNARKDRKGEVIVGRRQNEYVQLPTSDAPPTDAMPSDNAPPTEEDKEVEKVTSSSKKQQLRTSVSLDEDDFNLRSTSPNKYLTILRSENDNNIQRSYTEAGTLAAPGPRKKGAGPPVPPRRRSPGPDVTPPPISPRLLHFSVKTSSPGSSDTPPIPPPRPAHTFGVKMISSPQLPTVEAPPTSGSKGNRPVRLSEGSSSGNINIESPEASPILTTPTDSTHHHRLISSPPLPPKS